MVTNNFELPTEDAHCRVAASLTPDVVLRVCREQLGAVESGERAAWRYCRPVEALYHPGRYLRVAYVLLGDDAIPPERYWSEGQIVYLHWPVRTPMSRRGTIVRVAGCDVEAYCFPNDRRLRNLRRFSGRPNVAHLWQRWVLGSGTAGQAETGTIRRVLIRYVPEHKFVARIQANVFQERSVDAQRCSIAVRASSPETGRVLARRHNAVARLARKASKYLYVPQAVVVDEVGSLAAFEWVRGRSLLEKLRTGEFARVMRRMARTLAELHALPISGLERCSRADICHRAGEAVGVLAAGCPGLGARLAELDSELRRRLAETPEGEGVTLHNDLHWDQVRIRRKRYALLDLERMCTGDPLIDVANFATQVRLLGQRPESDVDPRSAQRWTSEFLEQWAFVTGRPIAAERFHLHAAVSSLELAASMMRHLRPGWRTLAQRCVDAAETELNRVGREAALP